jgi:hypothetical protein
VNPLTPANSIEEKRKAARAGAASSHGGNDASAGEASQAHDRLIGKGVLVIARQIVGFSRHRLAIVANMVVFAAVADKRIRNIWSK